jgi:hypothetical protein
MNEAALTTPPPSARFSGFQYYGKVALTPLRPTVLPPPLILFITAMNGNFFTVQLGIFSLEKFNFSHSADCLQARHKFSLFQTGYPVSATPLKIKNPAADLRSFSRE